MESKRISATLALLLFCSALSTGVDAQAPNEAAAPVTSASKRLRVNFLANRPWYEPLIADPRGAHISVFAFGVSKEFQYMQTHGNRRIWDISLGKEIPWVVLSRGVDGDNPPTKGDWGLGIWTPVSFHMVSDFKDASNPIINTDYRFGGGIKGAYGLTNDHLLGIRAVAGHESTHLGDEFTIHAIETFASGFERINVSYEWLDVGASWDWMTFPFWKYAGGNDRLWVLTLRASAVKTLEIKGDPGFYSTDLLDHSRTLFPSQRNVEPAVGLQLVPGAGNPMFGSWSPFLSLDSRWRTIYNYNKKLPSQPEDSQLSLSFAFGLRQANPGRGMPDIIFKTYHGVNPNGQFRNQRDYWMFGAGVYIRP